MSEQKSTSKSEKNKTTELTAKLYLALDDLAFSLATEENETVRQSDIFKKAVEVIKIVREMRKNSVSS
ncbi:hypothetical protein N617_gp25 [Stygiolobus rod-shaped virus]|uniref:Uncharacterized protein n=1 Tax=Stygiolobus rod-shaped virus TaxID=537009 RepID=B6EFD1_9VIRU|nr:hypothetical protein N617_gp25 [Stygiolobus rod-shaped virus]CAQ58466.1 hypothetical protein [Stygiolobus rod-shaped virus]